MPFPSCRQFESGDNSQPLELSLWLWPPPLSNLYLVVLPSVRHTPQSTIYAWPTRQVTGALLYEWDCVLSAIMCCPRMTGCCCCRHGECGVCEENGKNEKKRSEMRWVEGTTTTKEECTRVAHSEIRVKLTLLFLPLLHGLFGALNLCSVCYAAERYVTRVEQVLPDFFFFGVNIKNLISKLFPHPYCVRSLIAGFGNDHA